LWPTESTGFSASHLPWNVESRITVERWGDARRSSPQGASYNGRNCLLTYHTGSVGLASPGWRLFAVPQLNSSRPASDMLWALAVERSPYIYILLNILQTNSLYVGKPTFSNFCRNTLADVARNSQLLYGCFSLCTFEEMRDKWRRILALSAT